MKPKKNREEEHEEKLSRMLGDRRGDGGVGRGERGISGQVGVFKSGVLYVDKALIRKNNKQEANEEHTFEDDKRKKKEQRGRRRNAQKAKKHKKFK